MTTAEDINHPAIEHKRIHPSYIFVGCVTGWRKRKWACGNSTDFNHVIVNWMNIEKGNHRYQDWQDGNPLFDDNGRCLNVFVNYDFINTSKLKLLAGTKSSNVELLNEFIQDIVFENFKHGSKRGWMKILPRV